jgi:hypothetical protein
LDRGGYGWGNYWNSQQFIATIDGWQQAVCATIVAVLFLYIIVINAVIGIEQGSKYACTATIIGLQITYFIVVFIAATSDWTRLLWLIPEVPFETIAMCISSS